MAERTSKLPVRAQVSSFPSIGISMARANAFQGISAVLGTITDELENQADRTAIVQAKRKGTIAGATGVPTLTGEATLAGVAFDESARQSFSNQIDISSREKLAQLELEHRLDPAGFQKAATGFMSGMIEEIRQVDPAIAAVYGQTFQLRQATSFARVRSAYSTKIKGDLQGGVVTLENTLAKEVQGFAGDMMSGDLERSSLAFQNFAVSRERLKQSYMQIAPDETPIYDAAQREKALIRFDDEFLDAAGREFINQSEDKLQALTHLTKTGGEIKIKVIDEEGKEATATFPLMDSMTSDAKERLVVHATRAANAQSRAVLAVEAKAGRVRQEVEKATSKAMTDHVIEGTLSADVVEENRDKLPPSDYQFYRKLARGGGGIVDTVEGLDAVENVLMAARASGDFETAREEIKTLTSGGDLTVGTFAQTMSRIAGLEDRDSPKGRYHQNTNLLDDMMQQTSALIKHPDTALALPVMKRAFDRWWDSFKDPKSGEVRDPTDEEADAKILNMVRRRLPNFGIRTIEKALLGVPVPKGFVQVPGAANSFPGAVRTPEGRIDVELSSANYFKAFGITEAIPKNQWPVGLKKALKTLADYDDAVSEIETLMDKINAK